MEQIPDDPIIAAILRTGYPPRGGQDRRLRRTSPDGRLSGRPCAHAPGPGGPAGSEART